MLVQKTEHMTPEEILKSILKFIPVKPQHVLAVFVSMSFLVFIPDAFYSRLGLLSFAAKYQGWFFLVWALCGAFLLVETIGWMINQHKRKKHLRNLSEDEKTTIARYLQNKTKTQILSDSDGTANGLVKKGILFMPSTGSKPHATPFNIEEWAWEYLNKNKNLVLPEKKI